jgi:tight adherence protein B
VTATTKLLLFAAGGLTLIVLAVFALLVDRANKAKQTRIAALLKPYTATTVREARETRRAQTSAVTPAVQTNAALRLVGVRLDRAQMYPAPWWAILLLVGAVATGGAFMLAATVGKLGWLSQPVLWFGASKLVFGIFNARRARTLYNQMPDALAMIVRSVRSGIPVQEALRIVGREGLPPTSEEFERLYNQLLIGQSLPDALFALAKRTEVREYRFFAVALSLQAQTGGSLTDTLENLADVIRKRVAARARAHALSSEARMTMFMLAVLPLVAFLALAVISPAYIMLLIDTVRGRAILGAAILMLSMGMGSMQFLIKKALS